MEAYNVTGWLSVTALSLLLVPAVMGWLFLALRIAWWVLQLCARTEVRQAQSPHRNTSAVPCAVSEDLAVSPSDNAVCLALISPSACPEDEDAPLDVDGTEVWDSVMKNQLWGEFYGAMGEEELDNLSDYSPR